MVESCKIGYEHQERAAMGTMTTTLCWLIQEAVLH